MTDAAAVMARLPAGVALVSVPADLPKFAHLVVHDAGEHMGRWAEGVSLLERLRSHASFDASAAEGKAVLRSLAVLHACAGDLDAAEEFTILGRAGGDVPEASDRARIKALVASTLTGQHRIAEAARALDEAVRLAGYGPGPKDPAARALAVAGNNLAQDLERRETLSDDERALMLKAAQAGRDFWGIAGGWMEVERAEYRLAMSCIKAGLAERAEGHARECMRIVRENGSDAGELFFAHEVTARAHVASGDGAHAAAAIREAEAVLPTITDAGFRDYRAREFEELRGLIAGRG